MSTLSIGEVGRIYYRDGIKYGAGVVRAGYRQNDAPLSGEWADEPTPNILHHQLLDSVDDWDWEDLEMFISEWIQGYEDAFPEDYEPTRDDDGSWL